VFAENDIDLPFAVSRGLPDFLFLSGGHLKIDKRQIVFRKHSIVTLSEAH
jgi:hypothetical protein